METTATSGVSEIAKEAPTVGDPVVATTPVASVYSIYMSNIDPLVIDYQERIVRKFIPYGWVFEQVNTEFRRYAHADQMSDLIQRSISDVIVFLDIDCIPLDSRAFPFLYSYASEGTLVGAAQRANHIPNGAHIYAGPFCMAFSRKVYQELGSPVLREAMLDKPYRPIPGERGDVCEELTYVWEQNKRKIQLLRPTQVEKPLWNLEPARERFGHGTTYDDLFYHAFESRIGPDHQNRFIRKCRQVLGESADLPSLRVNPILVKVSQSLPKPTYSNNGLTQNWWERRKR